MMKKLLSVGNRASCYYLQQYVSCGMWFILYVESVPRLAKKVAHPLCLRGTDKLSEGEIVARTTIILYHRKTQILDSLTVS